MTHEISSNCLSFYAKVVLSLLVFKSDYIAVLQLLIYGTLQDYFPHNSTLNSVGQIERQTAKMAPILETEEDKSMAVTHRDLLVLSEDLKQHFTSLFDQKLKSVSKQMFSLAITIKYISSTSAAAYVLSKSQEHHIRELQVAEGMLKEWVALLEGMAGAMNLKFHGLLELLELNSNLTSALAS